MVRTVLASLAASLPVLVLGSADVASGSSALRAPATAPGPSVHSRQIIGMAPPGGGFVRGLVTAVGDSVMVDYQDELAKFVPGISVHAYVGQQFVSGLDELQTLRREHLLGAVVVVALGTNGPITQAQMNQMLSTLNGASRIVLVTNFVDRPWQVTNNQLIFATARQHRYIVIANWSARAKRNPGWLYSDHTHLPIDGPGARELAWIIRQAIRRP